MVDQESIRQAVVEQLEQQFEELPGPRDNWVEAGMDSLEMIDLLMKLEERFGRQIPVEKFDGEMNTESLVEFLVGYLNSD